jgi:predicted transcriptional regulator
MKQKTMIIKLIEHTQKELPWGAVLGKNTFRSISDSIDANPTIDSFAISFEGIIATDVSFAREGVVAVVWFFHKSKSIYLTNLNDRDIIDNLKSAVSVKDQPITIWNGESVEIITPEISLSNQALINYVLEKKTTSAAELASDLDLTVQNASTRLKKMVEHGYIRRLELVAETGGIEYSYSLIK